MKIEYKRMKTRKQLLAEYKTEGVVKAMKTNSYSELESRLCKSMFKILVCVENIATATGIVNALKVQEKFVSLKCVDSPAEAIEALNEQQYDLVLTEYRMSKGDGTDISNYVDKRSVKPNVIFISGFTTYERNNLLQDGRVCLPEGYSVDNVVAITKVCYIRFLNNKVAQLC